jgi:hypothetical protein
MALPDDLQVGPFRYGWTEEPGFWGPYSYGVRLGPRWIPLSPWQEVLPSIVQDGELWRAGAGVLPAQDPTALLALIRWLSPDDPGTTDRRVKISLQASSQVSQYLHDGMKERARRWCWRELFTWAGVAGLGLPARGSDGRVRG